jgi:hypothetical protein
LTARGGKTRLPQGSARVSIISLLGRGRDARCARSIRALRRQPPDRDRE